MKTPKRTPAAPPAPPPVWQQRGAKALLELAAIGTQVELLGIFLLFAIIAIAVWAIKTGH